MPSQSLSIGSSTLEGLDPVSSLCTSRHPSNVLTGVFVRLLREHFSSPRNLEFNGTSEDKEQLQDYIWNPDVAKRHIQIDAVWRYNAQDIQNRPGLYVKRNRLQYQQIALMHGYTSGAVKTADGKIERVPGQYQSVAVIGSHTVFCIGGSGAEAELLGMEVGNHFVGFSTVLRQELKLQKLLVTEVGEVSMLDEFVEHFVVPVVIGYIAMYSWRLDVEAPWLKTIAVNLTV